VDGHEENPSVPKYLVAAHPIQQALLEEAAGKGIEDLSLREIGKKIGVGSPQKIKHHLQQMVKYGFLDIVEGKYRVGVMLTKRAALRR
jgi:hypothetical protein